MRTWLYRSRYHALTILIIWGLLTLLLVRLLHPQPILELPIDAEENIQQNISEAQSARLNGLLRLNWPTGEGFTSDGQHFIASPHAGTVDKIVRLHKGTSMVSWNLATGESSVVDPSELKHIHKIDWRRDQPLGLDGLKFLPRTQSGWDIHPRGAPKPLYTLKPGVMEPQLARWSPNRRWLAIESQAKDILLVDLKGEQPATIIPGEELVQFTPDSSTLLTKFGPERYRGLAAWSLHPVCKKWSNASAPVTSQMMLLWSHRSFSDFASFKLGGVDNKQWVFPIDPESRQLQPLLFAQGQAFSIVNRKEMSSPWFHWLQQHQWYGIGSGFPWQSLAVIDLATGQVQASSPRPSLVNMECIVAPDERHLAILGRDRAPWHERWLIYRLPLENQYGRAMGYATVVVLSCIVLYRGWSWLRRWRRPRAAISDRKIANLTD